MQHIVKLYACWVHVGHVKSLCEFKEQLGKLMDEKSFRDCSIQRHSFSPRRALERRFLKVGVRDVFTQQFFSLIQLYPSDFDH